MPRNIGSSLSEDLTSGYGLKSESPKTYKCLNCYNYLKFIKYSNDYNYCNVQKIHAEAS